MLSSALRGNVCRRALEDLEQCLLYALAGNVARDRAIFTLARDLVDLVDVYNAALGALYVIVRRLNESQ